ncbi:hypothetical protein, partial [Ruminococcus callidus]|uniref:hypothetical protein n=1 Tax=Ruminococcus callidus TaxID=40519 RepID=UPI003FD78C5F
CRRSLKSPGFFLHLHRLLAKTRSPHCLRTVYHIFKKFASLFTIIFTVCIKKDDRPHVTGSRL